MHETIGAHTGTTASPREARPRRRPDAHANLEVRGKTTLIGELIGENNPNLDTVFNLGLRWERRNVTVDAVVVNDRGTRGGSTTRIPGMIRVNIAF